MGRKHMSLLLVLAMVITLLPGMAIPTHATETTVPAGATTMTAWAEGGYSESVTDLTINNEEDFKAFQTALTGSAQKTFEGYTIYLTADLDLNPDWNSPIYLKWENGALVDSVQTYEMDDNNSYWLPATSIGKTFNGVFDGMGHSISGLCTQSGDSSLNSGMAASLFGKTTGKNTVIKNLAVLDSAFVNGRSGQSYVKPLAGLLTIVESGAKATISNCYVDVDLHDLFTYSTTLYGQIGGLVGYCKGELVVEDTVYAGSITPNNSASGRLDQIGGIVGYVAGTQAAPAKVTVTNYVFTGSIYSNYQRVSGGIGRSQGTANITMTNCLTLGSIKGASNVAWFISSVLAQGTYQTVTLTDCYRKNNTSGMLNIVGDHSGSSTVTMINNGNSYVRTYKDKTMTTTGSAGDYNVKATNEATLAMPIGGGTGHLSDVYTDIDGTIVPKALNETFGEDTHMLLGESMSVWAASGYADLTTKVLRIKTTADFKAFQTALATHNKTFEGYTVYLTADLDLNPDWSSCVNLEWGSNGKLLAESDGVYQTAASVGTNGYTLPLTNTTGKIFNGTFDGMGHSLSGLYLEHNGTNSASLFGKTNGENTVIKNLAVLDSFFLNGKAAAGSNATSQASVKPLAGLFTIVESGAFATISNCYIDVDLYDGQPAYSSSAAGFNSKVGGLVGYCEGSVTIKDTVYAGSISNNLTTETEQALNNVVTKVSTKGKWRIGGAVGQVMGSTTANASVTMENYVYTGTIYNEDKGSSGGIGYCAYADVNMTNCLCLGQLYAPEELMGFVAVVNKTTKPNVTLTDCYKNGSYGMVLPLAADTAGWIVTVTQNGSEYVRYGDETTKATVTEGNPGNYNVKATNEATLEMPIGGEGTKTLGDVFGQIGATIVPKNLYQAIAPTIIAKSRTISLEGNIWINRYVNFSGFSGINLEKNAGLLIWNAPINEEDAVYGAKDDAGNDPTNRVGLVWDSDKGAYGQRTDGIAAPHYGDKLYMRAYVKVGDDYIYGGFTEYSVADYCTNKIKESDKEELKKLCAAVLNYGAAAQTRFDYDTENPVNANLSSELATAYDASMIKALSTEVNTAIADNASTIVQKATKSISLDEGIRINYYFKPVDDLDPSTIASAELLTWSGVAGELTEENAKVKDLTLLSDGRYAASGALVPAADCGETIYACAKFVDTDGTEYYTAVTAYSAHQYAKNMLEKDTTSEATRNVLEALIVYSYLADKHFAE